MINEFKIIAQQVELYCAYRFMRAGAARHAAIWRGLWQQARERRNAS